MAKFIAEVRHGYFASPTPVEKLIAVGFSNGAKLEDGEIFEATNALLVHVTTDTKQYDTVVFICPDMVRYTSSDAVKSQIENIAEAVSDNDQIDAVAYEFITRTRQSKSNASRRYMTISLKGVIEK